MVSIDHGLAKNTGRAIWLARAESHTSTVPVGLIYYAAIQSKSKKTLPEFARTYE